VVRKNLARERTLLSYWVNAESVRVTAEKTGIPEGSVSRYFARFNKDPEKYHRQVVQRAAVPEDPYSDLPQQVFKMHHADVVIERHDRLMSEGKFAQAKIAIEAEMLYSKYISSATAGVTALAAFLANPRKYNWILPIVIAELVGGEVLSGKSVTDTLDRYQKQVDGAQDSAAKTEAQMAMNQLTARYREEIRDEAKHKAAEEEFKAKSETRISIYDLMKRQDHMRKLK
jgi:hypothetical protein